MSRTLEDVYREAELVLDGQSAKFTDKTAKVPVTTCNDMQNACNEVQNSDFRGFVSKIPSPSAENGSPGSTDWTDDDWRVFFEERAAIAEHDGSLSPEDAEAQALECCVVAWMNANPVISDPDRCAHCGRPEAGGAQVVPFGNGPVWLHSTCWREWLTQREQKALAVLGRFNADVAPIRTG